MIDELTRLREENSDYRKRVKDLNDRIGVLKQQKSDVSAELERLKDALQNHHQIFSLNGHK